MTFTMKFILLTCPNDVGFCYLSRYHPYHACVVGAESSNECNPECNGLHLASIPTKMRKLLPPGYSAYLQKDFGVLAEVSPRRAEVRAQAAEALVAQGNTMQRLAERRLGRLPIVGDMVQVPIPDIDRSKMDAPCLTTIVVQVQCS
jgi:hypothetical protein